MAKSEIEVSTNLIEDTLFKGADIRVLSARLSDFPHVITFLIEGDEVPDCEKITAIITNQPETLWKFEKV